METREKWLRWAIELQQLAQAGLYYGHDDFDKERYEKIRQIAAEIMAYKTQEPVAKIRDLFCNEMGYQTPKLATRAAIFDGDKILLVRERDGLWAMPGGWVDVTESALENVIKESKEEAGLDVSADFVVAVLDRDKHNQPRYAYKVCIIFVHCTAQGGAFIPNLETSESGYFALDALPPLAEAKNTKEEIAMCFEAHHSTQWKTLLD